MKPVTFQILNGIRITIILIAVIVALLANDENERKPLPKQLAALAVIAALKSAK
jgi:hypothetical protein